MTDTRGKTATRGKAVSREKVDAESVLINGQIVMAMAGGTLFAVLMLVLHIIRLVLDRRK